MNLGESNKKIWNPNPQLLVRQNHILESNTEHSHTPLFLKTKKEEKFTYLWENPATSDSKSNIGIPEEKKQGKKRKAQKEILEMTWNWNWKYLINRNQRKYRSTCKGKKTIEFEEKGERKEFDQYIELSHTSEIRKAYFLFLFFTQCAVLHFIYWQKLIFYTFGNYFLLYIRKLLLFL